MLQNVACHLTQSETGLHSLTYVTSSLLVIFGGLSGVSIEVLKAGNKLFRQRFAGLRP
jgi:hypothetical protein